MELLQSMGMPKAIISRLLPLLPIVPLSFRIISIVNQDSTVANGP